MSVAKQRASNSPNAMMAEQKVGNPEKEGHDAVDNFIRQAVGKDPFLSFSRGGENPIQWIQLLQTLDQQGASKLSKGPKVDNAIEGKGRPLEHCNGMSLLASEMNGLKESVHIKKCSGVPVEGTKSTIEHRQTLKLPEAVVALAQAAAKANGEPDKYLPGWPLLSPPKMQMQKCDKCSREFCSSINYRRHIRVHRRLLNIDKDSPQKRDFLGAFWDKLSLDEAKEIVSFKSVKLEEVAGSSIIRALTSIIRKPGFSSLPQVYLKAGASLLDVVQARPSRFPISSQELFNILDDASEKTFLCAGTAVSLQKFVFDGEAGKIGLEMKNLISCCSFLVEQNLVKAWLANKDEEALRCQKQLVAEEEAAQKRQAELLEKKRLRKLKQKEQKAKEQIDRDKVDFKEGSPDVIEGAPVPVETSSQYDSSTPEAPSKPVEPHKESAYCLDVDMEACEVPNLGTSDIDMDRGSGDAELASRHNEDAHGWMRQQESNQQLSAVAHQLTSLKFQRNSLNGFHSSYIPASKSVVQKHNSYKDQRPIVSLANNSHKVWTPKTKPDCQGEGSDIRIEIETRDPLDQSKNNHVLIGSISVRLSESNGHVQNDALASALEQFTADHKMMRQNYVPEKRTKPDLIQNGANRLTVKLWRPVGLHDVEGPTVNHRDTREETEFNDVFVDVGVPNLSDDKFLSQCATVDDSSCRCVDFSSVTEGGDPTAKRLFSSRVAEAFLRRRWNEAIAADHVKLVLSSEAEPPDLLDTLDGINCCQSSTAPGNAENKFSIVGPVTVVVPQKSKYRAKVEKGSKLKYIPKQRSNA